MTFQDHMTARLTVLFGAVLVSAVALTNPSAAHAEEFEGPWVGVTTGYDTFDSGDEVDGSEDGITYGIAAGYDFNLGGIIAGVEGEISDSSVDATASDVIANGDSLSLSAGRDLYAGIRVGVPVMDNVLLYGKGGYTNQRLNAEYKLGNTTESASENLDGFRLGAGAELDLGSAFGRLEYRYSEYGTFSDTDLETSRHQVMVTAGLRF